MPRTPLAALAACRTEADAAALIRSWTVPAAAAEREPGDEFVTRAELEDLLATPATLTTDEPLGDDSADAQPEAVPAGADAQPEEIELTEDELPLGELDTEEGKA